MLANLKNLFGKPGNVGMFRSANGLRGPLLYNRPIGNFIGLNDAFSATTLLMATSWKTTLNSGTFAAKDAHPSYTEIVTDATGDAVTSGQLSKNGGTTAWAPFALSATDLLLFQGKIAIDDITNSAILFGLCNIATANIFGTGGSAGLIGAGITDFVGFHKPSGSSTFNGVARKASTSTSQTLTGYAVATTYKKLSVVVANSAKAIKFYVDDVEVYSQTTITNFPLDATALTLMIAVQTPAAAAKTLKLREVYPYQEAA